MPDSARHVLYVLSKLGVFGVCAATLFCLAPSQAAAQQAAPEASPPLSLASSVPPALRASYGAVLAAPGDIDRLYALARRAELLAPSEQDPTRVYGLAIRLYERILLIDPSLTPVRLRLGEIHFRRGSYYEARSHFEQALRDPALPAPMRESARGYLREIERELSPSAFSGRAVFGLRHQSNATAGPDDEISDSFGLVADEPDQDVFLSFRLVHSYDPGWQRGHTLETRIDGDVSRFFDLTRFNNAEIDLTFGPRLNLASYRLGPITLRPHAVGRALFFDDDLFLVDAGAGVDAEARIGSRWRAAAELRAVYKSHNDTDRFFDLSDRDGREYALAVGLDYRLSRRFLVGAALTARDTGARTEENEVRRFGASLRGLVNHPAPAGLGAGDWATSLTLGWSRALFGRLNDDLRREDETTAWRLATEVPVTRAVGVALALGETRRDSSFPAFEFENWEASAALAVRF